MTTDLLDPEFKEKIEKHIGDLHMSQIKHTKLSRKLLQSLHD